MTAKNFRVNNGITIGDIIIDAATSTITGLSTATPPTNPGDVATKSYVDSGLAGLSQNQIKQGDTEVTVTDSGTGQIVLSAESTTLLTVAGAGVTVASTIPFVTDTADINGGAIDGTIIGASSAAEGTFTTATVTTADINGGNIDGTAIGASSESTGAFTSLSASSGLTISSGNLGVSTGNLTVSTGDLTVSTGNASVAGTLGVTGEATFGDNVVITGNLNVQGTETIINTTTLSVEDNIIELNRNVSDNAGMPSISGIKVNRGEGSTATEQALFWAWDETFADDGSTIFGNSGGAWTAFKRADADESNPGASALVDIRANVIHATATSAQYADIAERFAADAPITPGAVVMLGGSEEITETAEDLSDRVFGVISTQPAYMMNNGAGSNETHPFVAMTGRTPVRVTGTVNKGDRLVSSSIKGTARAASADETINPFHVIGRALEDKFDDGIGMVNCVVRTNN
jgi:hypothetical protein